MEISDLNIIFKSRFGSHLYGTNTPNSDIDYKGVYMASLGDVLLKKDTETQYFNSKVKKSDGIRNTKDDIDFEVIELRKFLRDAMAGQTYALDMLFTPLSFADYSSWIWGQVLANRTKLLSKDVQPFIGYCRQQAGKYGLKGSRLGEIMRICDVLKSKPKDMLMEEALFQEHDNEFFKRIEIEVTNQGSKKMKPFFKILEKKFDFKQRSGEVVDILEKFINTYGERARLAQENNGIDWKAISHAYRCMYELAELGERGYIDFPLKSAEKLILIKTGKVSYQTVQEELPELMELSVKIIQSSPLLPEKPDYAFWDKFITQVYL